MTAWRVLLVQCLTLVRIPLAAAFAVALLRWPDATGTVVVGTVILALIEASDALDGFLARRLGAVTQWGAMLDPYADSVSRITLYWALAAAGLTFMVVPLVMALRDVTVAYCRIIWTRAGRGVSAQTSGKIKAIVQGAGAFFLLDAALVFGTSAGAVREVTSWLVLAATLLSLVDYCLKTVPIAMAGAASEGGER